MSEKGKRIRVERPGTGWGRSDSGSGRTPPPPGDGCFNVVILFTCLATLTSWTIVVYFVVR